MASPKLRCAADLRNAREIAETWHWRARTYQLARESEHHPLPCRKSYEEIVDVVATRAQNAGHIIAIDGDFPASGKAYRRATEEEWRLLLSIAMERHYALNWLTGTDESWDDVLTDT